ncbi:MAG TPA: hypothetical protein VFT22_28165 [Kofleriaceae bacterium]|nr:hypothetical protein [Kofleriaceae bacterium]
MGLVEEIYGPAVAEPSPPEAERWAFFLAHGVQPVCTFVRRRDGTAWEPPRLVIAYPRAQPELPPDPMVPWDPRLEDWLLAHRVPASNPANEAERIGFDLTHRLAAVEKRCGTPAFIAVLLRYLYDHDCPLYLPLERKIGAIRPYEPDAASAHTTACEAITTIFDDVSATLTALGYAPPRGKQIHADALAYYLRDRFELDNHANHAH